MSKYPNIEKLGLKPDHGYQMRFTRMVIDADDLERLLEKAVRVCAHRGPSNPEGVWIARPYEDADSTHTALLIGIEPIAKDTEESILREFYDRAKRLLEQKK